MFLSTTTHPPNCFCLRRFGNKHEKYRRFATAAEAIRYAVEALRTPKAFGAWHQNGTLPVFDVTDALGARKTGHSRGAECANNISFGAILICTVPCGACRNGWGIGTVYYSSW